MTQGSRWQDQWFRIDRWLARVRTSRDAARSDGLGTEGYRDEVFALFQSLWHLKDWFKNDSSLDPGVGPSVETWIRDHGSYLKAAADVANGSKHMSLKSPRSGGATQTRNDVTIHVGVGVGHKFYVDVPSIGGDIEAVELAERCLTEWRSFLDLHWLIAPEV